LPASLSSLRSITAALPASGLSSARHRAPFAAKSTASTRHVFLIAVLLSARVVRNSRLARRAAKIDECSSSNDSSSEHRGGRRTTAISHGKSAPRCSGSRVCPEHAICCATNSARDFHFQEWYSVVGQASYLPGMRGRQDAYSTSTETPRHFLTPDISPWYTDRFGEPFVPRP